VGQLDIWLHEHGHAHWANHLVCDVMDWRLGMPAGQLWRERAARTSSLRSFGGLVSVIANPRSINMLNGPKAKAKLALVGAIVTGAVVAVSAAVQDGWQASDASIIAGALVTTVLTAWGVYQKANTPVVGP